MYEHSAMDLKWLRRHFDLLTFLQDVLVCSSCMPLDELMFRCGTKRVPTDLILQTPKHFF